MTAVVIMLAINGQCLNKCPSRFIGIYTRSKASEYPPHCTNCNSAPINGQCTNHCIAVYWFVAVRFYCAYKGLMPCVCGLTGCLRTTVLSFIVIYKQSELAVSNSSKWYKTSIKSLGYVYKFVSDITLSSYLFLNE